MTANKKFDGIVG